MRGKFIDCECFCWDKEQGCLRTTLRCPNREQQKEGKPRVSREKIWNFKHVLWTIVGDSSSEEEAEKREMEYVITWLKEIGVEVEE